MKSFTCKKCKTDLKNSQTGQIKAEKWDKKKYLILRKNENISLGGEKGKRSLVGNGTNKQQTVLLCNLVGSATRGRIFVMNKWINKAALEKSFLAIKNELGKNKLQKGKAIENEV